MDINKLNIGKLFKVDKADKAETKKNLPLANDNKEVDEKSYRKYSNAVAAYAMAGIAAMGMTSCQDQNTEVNVDTSGLEAAINNQTQMLKEWQDAQNKANQQMMAQLTQIIELLQQNHADNVELKKEIQDIINQNTQIMGILNGLRGDVQNFDANVSSALQDIYNLVKTNDAEFNSKLQAIINGQGSNSDKLDKLLAAINEQNALVLNIAELIATLGDEVGDKIQNFYNDYKEGDSTKTDLLKNIYNELITSNKLNKEQKDGIDEIISKMENGQLKESEGIDRIIALLGSIDGKLDTVIDLMKALVNGQAANTEEMRGFKQDFNNYYNDWKSGNITTNGLIAKVLAGVDNLNVTDAEILGVIKDIKDQLPNLTDEEAIKAITNLLQQIKDNTDSMVTSLGTISKQIATLTTKLDTYNQKSLDLFGSIDGTAKDIDSKLGKVLDNQGEANQIAIEISSKMDSAIAELQKLNGKTLTVNDLKNLFGPMYEVIAEKLDNIHGGQLSIGDVIAAAEATKTDLTKTNAKIETLTNVVQNLNIGSGTSQDLKNIVDILTSFKGQSASDSEKVRDLLDQALERLASIDVNVESTAQNVKDIRSLVGDIKVNTDEQIKQNDKSIDLLTQINNKTLTQAQLKSILGDTYNKVEPYLQKIGNQPDFSAIIDAIEGSKVNLKETNDLIASLKHAINNQLTKADLQELLGDMYNQVQPYLEKIGTTNIDLSDVIVAIEASKTDLTKTNAKIETLTNVVQNLNLGTSYNPVQLQEITQLLNDIKNNNAADANETHKLINDVIAKLGKLEVAGESQLDLMSAILEVNKDIKANQDAYAQDFNKFGIQLFEELGKIAGGMGDFNKLYDYLESYKASAAKAEKAAQDQIALLQLLVDKEFVTNGGSSLTISDLRALMKELDIPNYTDILNEIKDAIGNLATKDDMEYFFQTYKTDLTKTNAKIETLTNVVQNKNFSGGAGSADMSRVETLLSQILDAFTAKKVPSDTQVQALLDAVNQVVANTSSASTAAVSTRAINAEGKTFHLTPEMIAAYNAGLAQASKITGKKAAVLPEAFYVGQDINILSGELYIK